MSSKDKGRIYSFLPSIYRQQDLQHQTVDGQRPLQNLTSIMDETLRILENDIEGLYENWFIETCNEWVAPYIGDLVDADLLRSVRAGAAVSGKTFVANTIHYRKRKGTVAILEEIARDITGWDARVVEFFQFISTTQNINHTRLENKCTLSVTDPEPLELIGTAFDSMAHTLDVRSIKNDLGYYNTRNLGIFLWRLTAYPVRGAKAFCHDKSEGDKSEGRRYSFSSIGLDTALFNHPADLHGDFLSKEVNVSGPIRREAAKKYLDMYYGANRSILLEYMKKDGKKEEVTKEDIIICDLSDLSDATSDWNVPVEFSDSSKAVDSDSSKKVAIDPVLGRILFSKSFAKQIDDNGVFVTYYYGFNADMGGGFYRRELYESEIDDTWTQHSISNNNDPEEVNTELESWMSDKNCKSAVFEIANSEIYNLNRNIVIPEGVTLILRSAQEQRATFTAQDVTTIEVSGESGSCLVLDGLLFDKNIRFKVIKGDLKQFIVQHCSLIPPTTGDCSILVEEGNDLLTVTLNQSISGKIDMQESKGQLILKDSIIDKGSPEGDGFAVQCFEASLENSTILGKSTFDILTLASNTLFANTIQVKRRQEGGIRFSYIPNWTTNSPASRIPRHYRCQPDNKNENFTPLFVSEKYGTPGYAQLHKHNAKALFEGADNGSEIGAFNQVYQSHRINNLISTFPEYLPFGLEAGIIIIT